MQLVVRTWGNFGETRLLMTLPAIHEKLSLGIIIVWSSKFLARKNYTRANFFKPVNMGRIARSSLQYHSFLVVMRMTNADCVRVCPYT